MPDNGLTITRRGALAGALGAAALAAARPSLAQGSGRKPNVLYIMADDLGYADLSCYGRRDYRTPVLDALAAEGMMFTHAYANSAVCTATRVGLITGRYQYRLPVGLHEPLGQQDVGLPPEHPTIASLMRQVGYATTLIGKWHMGSLPKYGPLKSGYDEFWGLYGGGVDYFRHGFGGQSDLWDGETRVEEAGYVTDLLAERTIAGMRKPPSSSSVFLPVNGQVSLKRSPPLSLVKTTIVSRSKPSAASRSSTRPTLSSSDFIIFAYVASDPPS